jgi:hypothetical protein
MQSILINLLLLTQVDPSGDSSAEEDTVTTIPIIWFILPSLVGLLIYTTCVMAAWPYARPIFPFWLLIFVILIPPFFPFLLFYMLIVICLLSPPPYIYDERPVQVVVVEKDTSSSRGRVSRGVRTSREMNAKR